MNVFWFYFLHRLPRAIFALALALGILLAGAQPALAVTPPPERPTVLRVEPEVEVNPYYSTQTFKMSDGLVLQRTRINGPSKRPYPDLVQPSGLVQPSATANTLANFPSFSWEFGCSAVSAAMIAAYYDRGAYSNIWGGANEIYPLTDSGYGTWNDGLVTYPNNPLVATKSGLNGLTQYGMIDDLWVSYQSETVDPYISAARTRIISNSAIGERMETSKSTKGNTDGGTSLWTNADGVKVTCDYLAGLTYTDGTKGYPDGTLGRRNFYQDHHYAVSDCYNQVTDNISSAGFTLANYQAEIDAGHPVFINLNGHSIVGYGYNGSTIYIRDTWDSNPNNVYQMTWGQSYQGMAMQSVSIVKLAQNAAPTNINISNSSVDENKPSGSVVGLFSSTDSNPYEAFVYALVPGVGDTDNASFQITENSLITKASFDYETKSSYSIRVQSKDYSGLIFEKAFTIAVNNINEAPTNVLLSYSYVKENQPVGTLVGNLGTTDPDGAAIFKYELVSGVGSTDNSAFTVTGYQLTTKAVFDYETKNSYAIRVRSTDPGGLTIEKPLTVYVDDVNEAPVNLALSPASVAENVATGTTVGTLSATDPEGAAITYSLVTGTGSTNNALFSIASGILKTAGAIDFEATPSLSIRVRASDGVNNPEKIFTITVTNVNEAPTDITLNPSTIAENQPSGTTIGNVVCTDPEGGPVTTEIVVGSTTAKLFSLQNNVLKSAAIFNYEMATSYKVLIHCQDGGGLYMGKEVLVTVTDVNEAPENLALSNTTLAENVAVGTTLGTLSATDPEGKALTYSLVTGVGSTNNGLFSITGNAITTAAAIDYEATPNLSIRVRVSDGVNNLENTFTVTVTNVEEAPTDITLNPSTIAENQPVGTTIGTVTCTDPEGGPLTTQIVVGSTTAKLFSLQNNVLKSAAGFNYEAVKFYNVFIHCQDSTGLYLGKDVVVTVTDVNEAPGDIALSSASVPENAAAGTSVGTLSATDPDANASITFSLVSGTGSTDNASFKIEAGVLKTLAPFDFETKATYSVRVRASDGSLWAETAFTITVTNVNEPPTALALSASTVNENVPIGTLIGTLTTTDPDSTVFTFSLADGMWTPDNKYFQVVGNQLLTNSLLDYETRTSYQIKISVVDETGGMNGIVTEPFTITVRNLPEAPVSLSLSNTLVAENLPSGTKVGDLTASDPEGGTLTYSLAPGGADNASFSLAGNSLLTAASFDYETKANYAIRLRVTDSTALYLDKDFNVQVTNVEEAPTAITLSGTILPENTPLGSLVGQFASVDPEGGSFTYSLVPGTGDADNTSFSIEGASLKTKAAIDYEAKASYQLRVRSTDGTGLWFEKSFTLAVLDVNEPPVNLTLSILSFYDRMPANSVVGKLSASDPDAGAVLSYAFMAGPGDADNSKFTLTGDQIINNFVPNLQTQQNFSILVKVCDQGGLCPAQVFAFSLAPKPPQAPTDILLSKTSIDENLPERSAVGTLSAVDPDASTGFLFSLVPGVGQNASFEIAGDQLLARPSMDYEAAKSYQLRVKVTDATLLSYEKDFTITVNDLNEAPAFVDLTGKTVPANATVGSALGSFLVTDPDENEVLTVSFADASSIAAQLFQIADRNLLVAASLDAYAGQKLDVTVQVTDKGGLGASATYTIEVLPAKLQNFTVSLPFITR